MASRLSRKGFIGAVAVTLSGFSARLFGIDQQQDPEQGKSILEDIKDLHGIATPIGAIIPFVGDLSTIGSNWQICDGAPLRAEADPALKKSLPNGNTPDFRNKFALGVGKDEAIAQQHGSNKIEISASQTGKAGKHSHKVNAHSHSLPGTTGSITNGGADPLKPGGWGANIYSVVDGGVWRVKTCKLSTSSEHAGEEGHHRHDLGGNTENAAPETESAEDHTHSVPAQSVDNTPLSITVLYIIRII